MMCFSLVWPFSEGKATLARTLDPRSQDLDAGRWNRVRTSRGENILIRLLTLLVVCDKSLGD
jgi:hypothetical protein